MNKKTGRAELTAYINSLPKVRKRKAKAVNRLSWPKKYPLGGAPEIQRLSLEVKKLRAELRAAKKAHSDAIKIILAKITGALS